MKAAPATRRTARALRRWSAMWALALLLPFLLSVAVPMTPAAAAPSTWEQVGGDIASLVAGDESGKAVAIDADGSRVAVGAPEHDGSRGTVRIYDWDGSSWTQVGNNIDGEAAGDQSGTAVSLSSDGSRVAIGAVYNDGETGDASDNRGHVRVYDWDAGSSSWIQVGSDIDGEATNDRSGYRAGVSISGNGTRVAIGASHNGGNGVDSGHVRVYEYSSGSWSQLGSDIDGESAGDLSGRSVSLDQDGSRVAIGAVHNDGNGSEAGHVRIYDWDAGSSSWVQSGADIDGEAAGDEMGFAVSLSANGSRLAAGAAKHDGNRGHVRIYDWDADSSSWVQSGADIDGEAAGDEMGSAVALSTDGSRLAAGAALNDGNGSNSGHVRIYDWNGSAWIQSGTDIDGDAADDVLGRAVALSADGSRVAVGAPGNDGSVMDAGHVRVYEVLTSSPSACSPSTTSYTSDSTEYTVVTFNDVGTCNWTVPAGVTSVDVLAVGGGGGGGAWVGGGGGGGGVTFSANVPVTPSGSIPVIVGAGGFGASKAFDSLTLGVNGASSSFGSASPVTALGGGVGASWDIQKAGGSGVASGGGGSQNSSTYAGGTGDTSSGGSAATDRQPHAAGGGGGAGGNGENGTGDDSSGTGGAGGPGGISDITGTSVHYGGGGGGGVHGTWSEAPLLLDGDVPISAGDGGVGGGGAGGGPDTDAGVDGEDGTDGLGGGGGGGATHWSVDSAGGDGGSGVVVLRYAQLTLTYDPRGGSGGPDDTTGSPSSTVSVSSTVPTRAGYTFTGWNTQADGSGTAYVAEDTFTLPDSGTATLHAQWQVNTVTLSYDVGGGSGGPAEVSGDAGSSVTVSSTVPTRSGHTFTGWNTQADGSGTAYVAEDTFTLPDSGTATLHAQWQVVETVTAPPSPPSGPSFVAPGGVMPSATAGVGQWVRPDGSSLPPAVSTPGANQVRYSGDGIRVTFTGAPGSSASRGLVADASGMVECEVCGPLAVGQVIEVWMFSTPRLIAAHRIEDLACQRFTIPVGAPLDGGGAVTAGVHTLQLALPTSEGRQAVNVGVTLGAPDPAPTPTGIPTGGGPVPVVPAESILVAALAGILVALTGRVRTIAAVTAERAALRTRAALRNRPVTHPRLQAFDDLDRRIAELRARLRG